MEALSPTMEEGQLVRWLKQEGDEIKDGDILAEIETDKATMELVARGSGILRKILLPEGETAPIGQVIGVIAGADEDISEFEGGPGAGVAEEADGGGDTAGERTADGTAEAPARRAAAESGAGADIGKGSQAVAAGQSETQKGRGAETGASQKDAAGAGSGRAAGQAAAAAGGASNGDGRIKASPLARKLASEAGLELSGVSGSGPGGRITKRDIEAAIEEGDRAPAAAGAPSGVRAPAAVRRDGAEYEDVPVSQMRKTIAKRLVQSIGPIPTFYLTVEVDMTRITEARERVNAQLADQGVKASINDFLVKAVAAALVRHPEVNAQWNESHIRRFNRAHVGIAVAVEDGLITPVVRDADAKGIGEIAAEVKELAGRARERKLAPEEYTGATFSISNLGMFGIDEFTAIINPPEAGILAIGTAEEKVVVEDGELVVRSRMKMTMSCDHRVIDGATGARFLQTLRAMIEEPMMMLA